MTSCAYRKPACALALLAACSSDIKLLPLEPERVTQQNEQLSDAGPPPVVSPPGRPSEEIPGRPLLEPNPAQDLRGDGNADASAPPGEGVVTPPCANADGDALCDEVDRCPSVADDGTDGDADGTPNACDRCPAVRAQNDALDGDADGIPDACDLCNGVLSTVAKGPLYYFSFDEAAGAVQVANRGSVPVSANYVGAVQLGIGGVADGRRSAVRIPGTNAAFPRVSTVNVPAFPSTALSAMAWVRTNQTTQYAIISYALADSANEFSLFVNNDAMRLDLEDLTFEQDVAANARITDGTWHFVAVTWQNNTAQFYFDGEPAGAPFATTLDTASAAFPRPDPGEAIDLQPGGTLIFGQDQDSLNGGFVTSQALNGGLDELAIFGRALSGDEIREIFGSTTCGERCDGIDNDGDGIIDDGFQGGSPACPARPNCQAIQESGSAFGSGNYFLEADPNAPSACVFP